MLIKRQIFNQLELVEILDNCNTVGMKIFLSRGNFLNLKYSNGRMCMFSDSYNGEFLYRGRAMELHSEVDDLTFLTSAYVPVLNLEDYVYVGESYLTLKEAVFRLDLEETLNG